MYYNFGVLSIYFCSIYSVLVIEYVKVNNLIEVFILKFLKKNVYEFIFLSC